MNAAEVMTRDPVTAAPFMSVRDVARLLVEHGISAVPVVDASGALVGIISEGDLVQIGEIEADERQSWWLQLVAEGERLAPEFVSYLRAGERQVKELMSSAVVTVDEGTPLPEIAGLLQRHRIKRVPVVRDGKLVGIVSRADIVRALAREEQATEASPRPITPYELSRPRRPGA